MISLVGLVFGVLRLVAIVAVVFGLVDAARRPKDVFPAASKQTKGLWLGLLGASGVAFFLFGPVSFLGLAGVVATIVYFVDVRPAVSQTSGGGPYGGW